MNIDIRNIGQYRLTSHGGRRFDLFNRETDQVYTISDTHYRMIVGVSNDPELQFETILAVEAEAERERAKALDVA